ncbi:MAG TPA: hypothetical protein VMT10_11375 [Solirubrobacteraceae bacterium]|nr:hypothetical protein [Solirubrobacteraceae bacterium]
MRQLPRLLPLALIATLALGGCGGAGSSGQDTSALLGDTFSAARPVTSGDLSLAVDVSAPGAGLPSPLHVRLDGPFARSTAAGPRFAMNLRLGTAAGTLAFGLIASGGHGWVVIGQHAYTLPGKTFRQLAGSAGAASTPSGLNLRSLGVDPRSWLRDVRDEGTTTLNGEQVVHLTAGVDTARLAADLQGLLGRASGIAGAALGAGGSASQAQLASAVKGAHVDIWTGASDHRLRRIRVFVNVKGSRARTGVIRLDLAIARPNQPQPIGPPANPRPMSDLAAALAVLLQRKAAGATGSATGETYAQCIARSGGDLAAAQKCASLLGG